ncbi:MAG: trypsin-like peptidase domain-containing protein [Anaerolineaceae bacterium]|nr:trypsin-like peptidase domain-containing protein [Anaerolineaceae bacterium]MDD4043107.1 trypsin-like peptidase domain-containing protein [Anaerolineaceae bacterium]MDD4576983.1 trypsin-like peptidase domain-containing protein [Anaerolineaceae bacterium]
MQKRTIRIIAFLLVIFLVGSACRLTRTTEQTTPEAAVPVPLEESLPTLPALSGETILVPEYTALEGSLEALYKALSPGVVSLQYTTAEGSGQGTGFVIDKEGHIVTNYHVASDVTELEVHFSSGLKVYGTVIGSDMDSDLAVVLVDVDPDLLVPLPLGDSNAVQVGQTVVAIGNPYGLSGTMTMGIVSARGRVLDSMRQTETGTYYSSGDTIQTDALINPGNSGGPLINLNGEVIGVNRAIQTAGTSITGGAVNTGIGFAISSNTVRKVVPSLIESGFYAYPYLGLSSYSNMSLAMIEALNLPQSTGAYVASVVAGGPADDAGIRGGTQPTAVQGLTRGGDLIIAVDGIEIKDFSELMSYLVLETSVGDEIILTVIRSGQTMDIPVILGQRE